MDDTRGRFAACDRQIPAWTGTVGPGWASLLDKLHRDLLAWTPATASSPSP
ncbi:hypothetical protein [Streptomyces caatingaensis]|uniref:hypothetical protein n=1 Tax=Streptomyces caatingaensis TaxID=1678637 RepID=UPI000B1A85C2|nr:hypothetical protein [Streptomyces caatingaensis]